MRVGGNGPTKVLFAKVAKGKMILQQESARQAQNHKGEKELIASFRSDLCSSSSKSRMIAIIFLLASNGKTVKAISET